MQLGSRGLKSLLLFILSAAAIAQERSYPSRPIRFIVPFAAGGGADIVARLMGGRMTEGMGVQLVIDNRAGASSTVGDTLGARATPDGYTINLVTTSYAVNPSFYKNLPFHPVEGVSPISLIGTSPLLAVVHPALPVKTIKDLIGHAKAHPGKLNYASTGHGGLVHLYVELFKQMTGIDMVHIPYKGTGPALNEIIAGQTQFFLGSNVATVPHVKNGRLRALAVTTAQRSRAMPDLPTVAEAGVPGFAAVHWFAVLGPGGLPGSIVSRLNAELGRVVALPDVAAGLEAAGLEPVHSSPGALRDHVQKEVGKFARIVKEANIRLE